MLQKIFFLAFWVTLCLPTTTNGQDRNVIWLHGLNGQSTDWLGFQNLFTGTSGIFKMVSIPPSAYTSSNGIQQYANSIVSQNAGNFTNNLITIAHSMGGVAARRVDLNSTANLGGIITIGSPLDGAGIATSIGNNTAAAAVDHGIEQVSKGPIAQWIPIPLVNNILITEAIERLHSKGTLDLSANTFGQGAINDLRIGGGISTDMNANPTNLPKISIFGNEESPVHWNMATTSVNRSGVIPLIPVDLAVAADIAEDVYYTMYLVDMVAGSTAIVMGFWNPWVWLIAAIGFWQADQWKQGYDWLCDSERIWNVLIGSNVATNQCITYQAYICYYPSNSSSCWQTRTSCFNSQLNGKSDGFIAANSQTGFNSTSWAGVPKIEALGVNHWEEVDANNSVMQSKFAEIFDNPLTYFSTNRR
jgi:pimeloyl-ACP methyl ester carboxylesterase